MPDRLRRLRRTPALRDLFRETHLRPDDFVYPIFVREGISSPEPIESMPGQFRLPVGAVGKTVSEAYQLGIRAILIFGLPTHKDDQAASAYAKDGVVQCAIREAKQACSDIVVMTDVCVCAFTPHGHCGVLRGEEVDNDASLVLLAKTAVSHAEAGADIVAPSSMMDRQVGAIRTALDEQNYAQTPIMAYSAKFSSAFYGPFRDAADSAPSFGDRASYQHDFANARHAKLEVSADIEEGADILMVKPGLAYLDILARVRTQTDLPLAVYNVSGEYSMLKAAAERGWLDERKVVLETLTAFRRAGADLIITYHALEASQWLNEF